MKFYKFGVVVIIFFIVFFIVFSYCSCVFADDEDFETLNNFFPYVEASSNVSDEPTINSRAAVVYDRNSGSILFGKNENDCRKMASTTKIMTALVVIENCKLNDLVIVSAKAAGTGGSRLGLHKNDKISVMDLLYGLLLCSGNDAAVALAEYVGGDVSGFAELMNKKAISLGLSSTHFVTPHGLDNDNHFTTAYELALITDYALENDTFCKFVGTKNYTVTINGYPKSLSNTNELLGNLDGVYGVKTGFTNGANRCLVTAIERNDMDLICVVLGADTKKDRTKDSIELIEYAFNNFKLFNIKDMVLKEFENWKLCNSSSFHIDKGCSNNLQLYLENFPFDFFPINSNFFDDFSIYIYCDYNLKAPLKNDTVIGYLTVSVHDKTILTLNIMNSNSVFQKKCKDFLLDMFKNYSYHLESLLYNNNFFTY